MRRAIHTIETLRMDRNLHVSHAKTAESHLEDGLMPYSVIGISGDHWQVHKYGCSATFSRPGQVLTADLVWAAKQEDIAPQVIDGELLDMGYDYSCVVFHNCTKGYHA